MDGEKSKFEIISMAKTENENAIEASYRIEPIENICAICLHKINSLITTICDIKKKYVITQALLKSYAAYNSKKWSWIEYRESSVAEFLLKSDEIQQQINKIDNFYVKEYADGDIYVKDIKLNTITDDDCTESGWLSGADVDVKVEHHYKTDENYNDESELNISHEKNAVNVVRINKRGRVYVSSSQNHVKRSCNGDWACKICKKTYKWQYWAEQHVRAKHTKEKPFKCHMCKRTYTIAASLNRHLSSFHEKKFICHYCGKRFPRRYLLTEHEKIHTGPPELKCTFEGCEKLFHSNLVMNRHIFTSHNEKEFTCDQCGRNFRTKFKLINHLQIHNKEKKAPKSNR